MTTTDDISSHFLNVRNIKRQEKNTLNISESDKILANTNKLNDALKQNQQYRNNLSDKDFELILKKQLVYELDDYKTNYSYKQDNNVDPEFNFNTEVQEEILDFVNKQFYKKPKIYKFMRLVNETFEKAIQLFIKEYKLDDDDIRLVFYNDIILRKIAEKFIYTLSNKSAINLSGYFDKYFNSESLDWYIILHPGLKNYEQIHSKLKFYIALVMKQLNVYIDINRRKIFEYFRYNNAYKQYLKLKLSSIIENSLNNLKEYNRNKPNYEVEETLISPNVHTYIYDNKKVLLNNNADKHLFQINIIEKENQIKYTQCLNFAVLLKHIQFNKNKQYRDVTQSIFIPIPLISVVLGNKEDIFTNKLIVSNKNVREYSYVFSLEDMFVFEGLSFKFICECLEKNAYDEEPWIIQNWQHIYGRLMFFYLIDLFVNIRSNRVRNSIVSLSTKYMDLLKDINKEFSKGDEPEMERIYEMLVRKYTDTDIKLMTLMKHIHRYNLTYRYNVKFKEFMNFIYDILVVIETIFRGVYSYCTQSRDVFEANLYRGDIKDVI
jgi:hypothetical protein